MLHCCNKHSVLVHVQASRGTRQGVEAPYSVCSSYMCSEYTCVGKLRSFPAYAQTARQVTSGVFCGEQKRASAQVEPTDGRPQRNRGCVAAPLLRPLESSRPGCICESDLSRHISFLRTHQARTVRAPPPQRSASSHRGMQQAGTLTVKLLYGHDLKDKDCE